MRHCSGKLGTYIVAGSSLLRLVILCCGALIDAEVVHLAALIRASRLCQDTVASVNCSIQGLTVGT